MTSVMQEREYLISAMNITDQQTELFEKLRLMNPEIIEDGVVVEEEYTSAAYRIMYVLKEVNGGSGWSLCEHLRNGGRQQKHDATWDNIARWTEGILHLDKEIPWSDLEENCEIRRSRLLRKICAINVKKTSGSCVSVGKEIYESAQQDADILKSQLELYAPDIVICCGTAGAFADACFSDEQIEWKRTTRGVGYFIENELPIVSFSHPAARVKDCYLHYALMDALREILNVEVK